MIKATLTNDELELQMHRARMGMVPFKPLALRVMDKGYMTMDDFLVLNESAKASSDYQDSLTLNKLTVIFNTSTDTLH